MFKISNLGENSDDKGQECVKVKVFVHSPELKKYETEFINIQFVNKNDQSVFIEMLQSILDK